MMEELLYQVTHVGFTRVIIGGTDGAGLAVCEGFYDLGFYAF